MASKGSTHSDCPLPPGSRVAGYFRDSGGDEQERSVDQQRRVAEEYCQQHHLVLVRVFADVARPGSTIVGRDGFDDLMHYCRQHAPTAKRRTSDAPDGILLWDLKRCWQTWCESCSILHSENPTLHLPSFPSIISYDDHALLCIQSLNAIATRSLGTGC